jgi:hypothetical protein
VSGSHGRSLTARTTSRPTQQSHDGCTPPVATYHLSSGNSSTPPSARNHRPRPHSTGVHLPRGGPEPLFHRVRVARRMARKDRWRRADTDHTAGQGCLWAALRQRRLEEARP